MTEPPSKLERRIYAAEKLGEQWAELHAKYLQLDEDKKSFLSSIMNDLDNGSMSETKLERLARGSKAFRDYVVNLALAKGEELRAKVRYDNAQALFSAAQSDQSLERTKMAYLNHIP